MAETTNLPEGVRAETVFLARDERKFSSVREAVEHNEDLARSERATEALRNGASVYDAVKINSRFPHHDVPEILKRITAETPLIISYWQCRDTPEYQVIALDQSGDAYVSGDSYGNRVNFRDLARYAADTLAKHPHLAATPPLDLSTAVEG